MYSPFLTKKWENDKSNAVINWDVYGYYLYLPSFFYDDPGDLKNYDYIHNTYHPGGDSKDEAFIQPNTGKYVMNYSGGQAIIELPAFIAGHLWAKATGYKTDGFTLPYQVAICFWCVIVSCFGLWIMRKLLLRYFDDWLTAILIAVICLDTNFYNFAAFSPMTHNYLFTIYALILYLTDSFYRNKNHSIALAFVIGLLSGLATITRPTEIICAIIPLLWGVTGKDGLRERVALFLNNKKIILLYLLGAVIAAAPQLIYWHVYSGHWLFFSYHGNDKTFSFLRPHILNVLFSYRKGWFVYTPVMILSILGFYQLYKNYRQFFIAIALFTILNIYLVSAWDCWWYGGSFSMRAVIQSYPLLMFPMGAFLNEVLRKKYLKYITGSFLLFCLWLNMIMTYQANGQSKYGMMESEAMTRAYFWRLFGKTDITLKDKKLLDASEEMPEKLEPQLKEIYTLPADSKFLSDTVPGMPDKKTFRLDRARQWSDTIMVPLNTNVHKGWYRIYCSAFYPEKEGNTWQQTQFTGAFYKGGKTVKEEGIRIQRITEQGLWNEVYVDIRGPNKDYDGIYIYFWNANSSKAIYISNIKVAYTSN